MHFRKSSKIFQNHFHFPLRLSLSFPLKIFITEFGAYISKNSVIVAFNYALRLYIELEPSSKGVHVFKEKR